MTLGEKLKSLREKNGLSVRQLASLVGKDPAQITRWETGKNIPTIYSLRALAFALETDINDLLKLL